VSGLPVNALAVMLRMFCSLRVISRSDLADRVHAMEVISTVFRDLRFVSFQKIDQGLGTRIRVAISW